MITITKHLDTPLTLKINFVEQLNGVYNVTSLQYIPNILANSAEIILNLAKTQEGVSLFDYVFYQVLNELDKSKDISIQITAKDEQGKDITHQASSTFTERPFQI